MRLLIGLIVSGAMMLACAGPCSAQDNGGQVKASPATPPVDTGPVVCEADLDVTVEKVWNAFTTGEGIKLMGVAQAKIDLRVGGKMLTHYSPNGVLGDEGTIENTYLAFEPMHVIAFHI